MLSYKCTVFIAIAYSAVKVNRVCMPLAVCPLVYRSHVCMFVIGLCCV